MQTFARHLDFTGIVTWIPCIDPVHFLGDSWKCRKALSSSCGVYLNSIALLYQKVQSVLQCDSFCSTKSGFCCYVGTGSRLAVSDSSRDVFVHMGEMEDQFY